MATSLAKRRHMSAHDPTSRLPQAIRQPGHSRDSLALRRLRQQGQPRGALLALVGAASIPGCRASLAVAVAGGR
eukprot:407974-Alexandrium_andersonii.AAC.1